MEFGAGLNAVANRKKYIYSCRELKSGHLTQSSPSTEWYMGYSDKREHKVMLSGRPQKQLHVKLPPLLSSDSIGCFRAVMSLKVSRNSTTRSRSFFMGAIWSSSHSGVSAHRETACLKIYAVLCITSSCYSCNKSCITLHTKKKIGGIVEKLLVALLLAKRLPSLLYLQTPATNPDPEPDESNPQTSHIHKTHFKVRLFL